MAAKILLADDSNVAQRMGKEILSAEGFEVLTVSNGHAAVKKLNDLLPNLILADVFMPGNTGYEVCEFVKSDRRLAHIPVVLLVGAMEPYDPEEGRRVKADGVITKPLQSSTLISIVKDLLASTDSTDAVAPKENPVAAIEKSAAPKIQENAAVEETPAASVEIAEETAPSSEPAEPFLEVPQTMVDQPIAAFEELVHPEIVSSEQHAGPEFQEHNAAELPDAQPPIVAPELSVHEAPAFALDEPGVAQEGIAVDATAYGDREEVSVFPMESESGEMSATESIFPAQPDFESEHASVPHLADQVFPNPSEVLAAPESGPEEATSVFPTAWESSESEPAFSATVAQSPSYSPAIEDNDWASRAEPNGPESSGGEMPQIWETALPSEEIVPPATAEGSNDEDAEPLRSTEEILAAAGFFPNFGTDLPAEAPVQQEVLSDSNYVAGSALDSESLPKLIWTAEAAEVTEEDRRLFEDVLPDWQGLAKMVAAEVTKDSVLRMSSEGGATSGPALPAVETISESEPLSAKQETPLFDSAMIEQMVRQSVEEMMPQLVERIALNLGIAVRRDHHS